MGGCVTRQKEQLLIAKQQQQQQQQQQEEEEKPKEQEVEEPAAVVLDSDLVLSHSSTEKPPLTPTPQGMYQLQQQPHPHQQLHRPLSRISGAGSRTGTPTRCFQQQQQSQHSQTSSPLQRPYSQKHHASSSLVPTPEPRRRCSVQVCSAEDSGGASQLANLRHSQLQYQLQQLVQQMPVPGTRLVCVFDYAARTEGEVSFRAGDLLQLLDPVDTDWWFVEHSATRFSGYAPVALVAVQDSLDAQSWFAGLLPRKEAERLLLADDNCRGTFLIRRSENHRESYSLSVLDCDQRPAPGGAGSAAALVWNASVKHYRIRAMDDGAGWFITSKRRFPSMQALVDNYSEQVDGLCCRLTRPCPRAAPVIADLSYRTRDQWEIPRDQIRLQELLGSGQFGEVWRGLFNNRLEVAVKMLKSGSMARSDFLKEARIMKRLRHPRLVQLYAVCTDGDPVYIVTELMSRGSLLTCLRDSAAEDADQSRRLELPVLVDIMGQIASGMAYLEAERFIHRDLAARNILVGKGNNVKVADFGLSRALGEGDNGEYTARQGAKFPIKWTSPEAALLGRFSIKSDVWSFGIVLYEIVTRGQVPYASMSNTETLTAVENGYRLGRPADCHEAVYALMLACWDAQPERRPTFAYLRDYFDDFFPASEPSYRLASAVQSVCISPKPQPSSTALKANC